MIEIAVNQTPAPTDFVGWFGGWVEVAGTGEGVGEGEVVGAAGGVADIMSFLPCDHFWSGY